MSVVVRNFRIPYVSDINRIKSKKFEEVSSSELRTWKSENCGKSNCNKACNYYILNVNNLEQNTKISIICFEMENP